MFCSSAKVVGAGRVVIPARLEVVSWWEVKVKYVWKEVHGKTMNKGFLLLENTLNVLMCIHFVILEG